MIFEESTEVSVKKGNETIEWKTKAFEDMLILNEAARKKVKKNTILILKETKKKRKWRVRVYEVVEENPGLVLIKEDWT